MRFETNRDKMPYMKKLVQKLNMACNAYYNENREIMSNKEFDKLYDELAELEKETGVTLSISPTLRVGYEVKSFLPKVVHEYPAKSLSKTKDINELKSFLGTNRGILSYKMDGLTVILTYQDGTLLTAVSRGNGEQGEDITSNARTFNGIPMTIPYKEKLVIRGEAIISYEKFNEINASLPEEEKYANPRNLASGSVRQLDSSKSAQRGVDFIAFEVVKGFDELEYKSDKLLRLDEIGFTPVKRVLVTNDNLELMVQGFTDGVQTYTYPVDGLVLTYDSISYSVLKGETAKYPLHSIAFKWQDVEVETKLINVEWQTSRTGVVNPVAVFEPVEIEGTTVERASIHNVDIFEDLELGCGDTLTVYKANLIIPQVADNLTRSGTLTAPKTCPACGEPTEVRLGKTARNLYCTNDSCNAKIIKRLSHFVSRNAMNIDGLSEATLDKFIEAGIVNDMTDIYKLSEYKTAICRMDGMGLKSYNKLIESIEKSKTVNMANFIYALGIPNVGLSTAKDLVKAFDNDFENISNASRSKLMSVDGIGEVVASNIHSFFEKEENDKLAYALFSMMSFEQQKQVDTNSSIAGKTFVITGDVHIFKNRKEVQAKIEELGGKVSGSVSSKTDYLINNDSESNSSKSKKAKDNNVPIITEEEFLELIK